MLGSRYSPGMVPAKWPLIERKCQRLEPMMIHGDGLPSTSRVSQSMAVRDVSRAKREVGDVISKSLRVGSFGPK